LSIMLVIACETSPSGAARMKQIAGVEWVVEDIDGRGVVDNSRATLNFSEAGRVSGRGSCNSYSGEFTLTATGIAMSKNVTATMMACVPALMEQERRFFDALSAAQSFEIASDGALVLRGPGGKSITVRKGS
jgi:heat shock protein HslJ